MTCWRSECRNGCYYPNVCGESTQLLIEWHARRAAEAAARMAQAMLQEERQS